MSTESELFDLLDDYGHEVINNPTERRTVLARIPLSKIQALITRQVQEEEAKHLKTIYQRDNAEEWADALAAGIAYYLGIEIGEHSNVSSPWEVAKDALSALAALTNPTPADSLNLSKSKGLKPSKSRGLKPADIQPSELGTGPSTAPNTWSPDRHPGRYSD